MAGKRQPQRKALRRTTSQAQVKAISKALVAAGISRPPRGPQPPDYEQLRQLSLQLAGIVRHLDKLGGQPLLRREAVALYAVVEQVLSFAPATATDSSHSRSEPMDVGRRRHRTADGKVKHRGEGGYPEITDVSVRTVSGGLPESGRRR